MKWFTDEEEQYDYAMAMKICRARRQVQHRKCCGVYAFFKNPPYSR
ncbi:MAG: hypothetical protein ACLR56_08970 [Oscillospiraceae bacterium]